MRNAHTSRGLILRALLIGLLAGCSGGVFAQHHAGPMRRRTPVILWVADAPGPEATGQQVPAPIERREPPITQQANRAAGARGFNPNQANTNGPEGDHLAEWMNHHRGWTLQELRQALEREPGFRELPVPIQQRYFDHLAQLNAMDPQHRARILALNEAMERLSLQQRSEVRGVMQQLGSLPPHQRQEVARSFRELRMLPPYQRMAVMNSGRYNWLNYEQRTMLINLLRVEPMLPPSEPQQPR